MKKKRLSNEEIKVLSILYRASKPIQSYTLFKRSALEKSRFFKTVRDLEKNKHLEISGITLTITAQGIEAITATKRIKSERPWRQPLPQHVGTKIPTNALYIPKRSLLSKGFQCSLKDDILR